MFNSVFLQTLRFLAEKNYEIHERKKGLKVNI